MDASFRTLWRGLTRRLPDRDLFYETALRKGFVSESRTETFFAEAARLAEPIFPSRAALQRECLSRAAGLREDYDKLVTEAGPA